MQIGGRWRPSALLALGLLAALLAGCGPAAPPPTVAPASPIPPPSIQPTPDPLARQLDPLMPRWLEDSQVPGAAVALVRDGRVAWTAGYGRADRATGRPVTPDTVFQVASISKAVTAWGVLRLVEGGRLDLDAPIEQYLTRWHLPPSEYDAAGVTVRRLLSHSAGLSLHGYPGLPPDQDLPTLEESLSGNNGGAGAVYIALEPATQFSYSGGGYTLLQLVVEEVTDEPFAAYMQREVLDPLGMAHSSFAWRADLRPATAVGYDSAGEPLPNYLFTEQAAAGLYTTAADLARFVAAALPGPAGEPAGRGVLAPETLGLLYAPAIRLDDQEAWGLGHQVTTLPDGRVAVGHSGGNRGWQAYFMGVWDEGWGIVVLTNSDNGWTLIERVVKAAGELLDAEEDP